MKQLKNIIIAFTLGITPKGYSQDIKGVLKQFENINQKDNLDCSILSDEEVYQLCFQHYCGSSLKKKTNDYLSAQGQAQLREIEKKLEDEKNSIYQLASDLKRKQQELKNADNPLKIKNDDDAFRIISLINIGAIKSGKKFNITLKGKKIITDIPKESPYYQLYSDVLSKIDPQKNLYALRRVGVTIDDQIAASYVAKKIEYLKDEFRKKNIKFNFDENAIKNDLRNRPQLAWNYYNNFAQVAENNQLVLEDPFCDESCKKGINKHFKVIEYFDPYKAIAQVNKDFEYEDILADCRAQFSNNYIKNENKDDLRKEWPLLIERFKANSSLGFSEHSKGILLKYINEDLKVYFDPAPPSEVVFRKFRRKNKDIDFNQPIPELYETLTSSQYFEKEYAKFPRCELAQYRGGDQLIKSKDELYLSPFSCEHAHIGKEIMAHELGHGISFFIAKNPHLMSKESSQIFLELRECSRSEKPTSLEERSETFVHKNDKQTTEEDTADLMGYALSRDPNNFSGCYLVSVTEDQFNVTPKKNSAHSPSFQRLLIELQYKQLEKLNSTCVEATKRAKATINKKCL